jgi:AraC family transcriptional regulator
MSTYEVKIKMAVSAIVNDLSSDLNWRKISKMCGISEYHFHRIFTSQMKETPRDFIIRKRLEKAISRLAYNNKTELHELAFDCGYSSQANFNKAFKAYFGVTPGQVLSEKNSKNSKIGKIKSKYGKDFNIQNLYPVPEIDSDPMIKEVIMNANIKNFPERIVVFESSQNGYVNESIHLTWKNFLNKLSGLGNSIPEIEKFGVGHDNPQVTPLEKCRYDACVLLSSLNNVPSNLKQMSFPDGKYACFHYKGSSEKLLQFYLDIYKNWFSNNSCEPGDFPLIERYIFVDKDNPEADIELETQFLLK